MAGMYRELVVWQKAMDLAEAVYRATDGWPAEEQFGLVSQMRRCGVSVASNIAEGSGRNSDKDFVRFLRIAVGSVWELETQIILAGRLGLGDRQSLLDLLPRCQDTSRLAHGLIRSKTRK